jgi:hypothetical protein
MLYLGRILADFKDLIIVFFVGLVIGYVLRGTSGAVPAQALEMSNLETWDMKELSDGTIRVVVHRKVRRG